MNIGFDLDRVFINYPPFVPGFLIDWLYRLHGTKALAYRIPDDPIEIKIRKLSHFHYFRPAIKTSVNFIRNFSNNSHPHHLYLISSRYNFLEQLTYQILKRYGIFSLFTSINLNTRNEQPHLFKERLIKKLKIDLYIDDDLDLLTHLNKTCPRVKLLWYNHRHKKDHVNGIATIHGLNDVNKYLQ